MTLHANTTITDTRRCLRALIACANDDKLALDVVLAEVMHDPTGVPGILFELLKFGTLVGERAMPDLPGQLRVMLLADQIDGGDRD